ncbi:HET-domain-containing protein, partial [Apiospora kogelbergensis]|uniref:HET-domain-containing protein n=1 Tax=Apiospora kogelbergensis TaxID=1337665 RepID=UPI0031329772
MGYLEFGIAGSLIGRLRLDFTDYVAFSYARGSPKATRPVLIEDVELQVTVSLEYALRHLRRQSEALIIWIDAIAIDQQDLDERGQQVKLMPRIYREAFKVIVWLGDGIRHRITNSSDYGKPPSRVIFYGDDRDDKQVAAFIQNGVSLDPLSNTQSSMYTV